MNILILGGSSLLGKYMAKTNPGHSITTTWYTNHPGGASLQMDVCDLSQVLYVFDRAKPDIVFHFAAVGNVDWCEQHQEQAHRVIVRGLQNVLEAAKGVKVVYASSNAVYDGENPPYNEESPREPVNAYGRMRKQAEDILMAWTGNWVLARLFLLYGWPPTGARGNWVETVIRKLRNGDKILAVNDHFWQPTFAGDCAAKLWELSKESRQSFNVAGSCVASFFAIARTVAEVFRLPRGLIEGVSSSRFPGIAPRPRNTEYDCSKIGGPLSNLGNGLWKMRAEEVIGWEPKDGDQVWQSFRQGMMGGWDVRT